MALPSYATPVQRTYYYTYLSYLVIYLLSCSLSYYYPPRPSQHLRLRTRPDHDSGRQIVDDHAETAFPCGARECKVVRVRKRAFRLKHFVCGVEGDEAGEHRHDVGVSDSGIYKIRVESRENNELGAYFILQVKTKETRNCINNLVVKDVFWVSEVIFGFSTFWTNHTTFLL